MSNVTFIDDLLKTSNEEEKQQFIQAQYKTILELTKKNKNLEDEVNEMKKLVSNTTKLELSEKSPLIIGLNEPDEVTISKLELRKLKEKSYDEPLSLEETKRVEIYAKILNQPLSKPKDISTEAKLLTDKELLALAKDLSSSLK